MPKIDENRDEEILDEEEVEEENDAAEDEEEDSDSADEKDEEETEEEDESEDDEKGDEEEEKGKKDKKDDKGELPEKFKGKSTKQIIDMYTNLEGMIADKALEMAGNFLKKKGLKAVEEEKGDEEEEFDLGLTDDQISKMTPKDFAKHLNRKITEKATKIAQETLERSEEVRGNVKREIAEATKTHPHLKENKEYRDVVLSIIEAANAKGEVVTLKSACEKADRALGVKKEEKKDKKPLRTAVEKGEGGDEGKPMSDEDKVLKGIVNAGKSNNFLGGLGV